jgi:hypothetical protein
MEPLLTCRALDHPSIRVFRLLTNAELLDGLLNIQLMFLVV